MGPIKKSDIVAGDVAATVAQAGGDEAQQLQSAQFAASLVERAEKDLSKRKAEDVLEAKQKVPRHDSPPRNKPTQPPGPGLLNRIVRFFNLK